VARGARGRSGSARAHAGRAVRLENRPGDRGVGPARLRAVNSGDSLVRRSTEHHRRTKSWLSCAERVARLAVCEPTAGTPADHSVGPQVSAAPEREPHHRRITRIAAWIIAVVLAFLRVAGVDVWGWLQQLWDTVTEISVGYVILGCFFQGLQTVFGWYGILKYAPPRAGDVMPVLATQRGPRAKPHLQRPRGPCPTRCSAEVVFSARQVDC
jgi:hypothetical protein